MLKIVVNLCEFSGNLKISNVIAREFMAKLQEFRDIDFMVTQQSVFKNPQLVNEFS